MQTLKPLPEELYEFYHLMSAQTHEVHVKAYAKSHMKEENTRPAAPVEGSDTKAFFWQIGLIKSVEFVPPSVSSGIKPEELVTRSQAEAIIAAKDAQLVETARHYEKRVSTLQADNAALTAKAVGVEDYIKGLIDDRNVIQERAEALETQLAAAHELLRPIAEIGISNAPKGSLAHIPDEHVLMFNPHTHEPAVTVGTVRKALAALEAKP